MSQDQQDALYPGYVKLGNEPLATMLEGYRNGERGLPGYAELAQLAAAPAAPAVPIKGAYLNKHGGITLCQPGKESEGFGFVSMIAPALQVIDAPRVEPIAWFRHQFIHDEQGYAIGMDEPEFVYSKEDPSDEDGSFAPLFAAPALPIARQAQPTDLSKRLRAIAAGVTGDNPAMVTPKCLTDAAEEIERYYGGMLAWKQTAEKKDRDWNEARMARENDRIAARAQPTDRDAEVIGGVPIARLLRNLEETSYNEGSEALACRLSDCHTVIKSLLKIED